jgi:hypothetical protein
MLFLYLRTLKKLDFLFLFCLALKRTKKIFLVFINVKIALFVLILMSLMRVVVCDGE